MNRKLDMEIAEKVFKKNRLNARQGLSHGEPEYHWGYPVGHAKAPEYSSDILLAWTVLEEMQKLGYVWFGISGCQNWAFAYFSTPDKAANENRWVYGNSTPEAICQAALEVLEDERD